MKHRDIVNALNDIDFNMIEDAGRVTRKTSIRRKATRWSSLAACLCLVLAVTLLLPALGNLLPSQRVDFINHSAYSMENLWVPSGAPSVESGMSSGVAAEEAPSTMAYRRGFGIVARVVEILPDIYVDAGNTSSSVAKYHILKLEILEELYGENMPREIYFRLRSYLDPSLDEYDYIVIGGMRQVGFEDYAMINVMQKRAESFTLLFECQNYSDRGAILPFKNGKFSLEHWKKDGWLNWFGDEWEKLTVARFCYGDEDFPAWEGCTLKDTKRAIKALRDPEKYSWIDADCVRTKEIFATEAQKEILAYVKPYENGLFAQSAYCDSGAVWYTRNIGGFITNETIRMTDEGKIEHSGERFTKEDLENIQDLGAFVSALDITSLEPPHTPGHEQMEITTRYFRAKYVKHNGTVYGVVRVVWTLKKAGESWRDTLYYEDDLYYLIMPDGTCRTVETDELPEYIGDDWIITKVSYGVGYPGMEC